MEPLRKKAKITGHFRVALKPRDANIQPNFNKHKKLHDYGKENVEIITIADDNENDSNENKAIAWVSKQLANNKIVESSYPPQSTGEESEETDKLENLGSSNSSEEPNLYLKAKEQIKELRQQHLIKDNDLIKIRSAQNRYIAPIGLTRDITDHDESLLDNVFCEPYYAWDSFQYDREQELKFRTTKYLDSNEHDHQITPRIRARLVDWLVDIQNDFRLDHEPLYMAVKLADQFLMKKSVSKQHLELLYMTSIFISVKFDCRPNSVSISELIQEFGGRYDRRQIIRFEIDMLSTLGFELRFPLSYGFLRRYARCTCANLQTLTLARYILESSLLEYDMIDILESKIAAACLSLASKMLNLEHVWDGSAEYYTGYKESDLYPILTKLNDMLSRPQDNKVSASRRKYSDEVFMSVARIPPIFL